MDRGSRRIDRLFEVALILLTMLAATEFQYVCTVPERQVEIPYAFKILSYPIVVLIVLWLIKEIVLAWSPRKPGFKMAYTEFCWDFWAITLFLYLVLFQLFAYGHVSLISALFCLGLSGILSLVISIGYEKAEPGMVYFRPRWKRLGRSAFIFALAIGLAWLIFIF